VSCQGCRNGQTNVILRDASRTTGQSGSKKSGSKKSTRRNGTHNWKEMISPAFAVTLHYRERPRTCGGRLHASPLGIVGQSPILADLDGDILGPDASSKAQENGNDSETHV